MAHTPTPSINIAMIGHGFMAHSKVWRVAPRFFDLPMTPRMSVIIGRDPERTEIAANTWGGQQPPRIGERSSNPTT